MMSLNLEALFSVDMLRAYRESWGRDPTTANRLAAEIIGMFEKPASVREAWLRDVTMALVGEEPDLNSWVAAFGLGSFDLRPDATYGHAKDKGSPSRFIKRQRELIDGLIDKRLPPAEREMHRLAYQDALRLIVASMVVRELRVGVAAKAAIGTGWPLMVTVKDHLLAADKRQLQRLGGKPGFRVQLAKAISSAIGSWIASTSNEEESIDDHSPLHANELPPGVDMADALAYLDREAIAVQGYRSALLAKFNLVATARDMQGRPPSVEELSQDDAAKIGAACPYRPTASLDAQPTDGWHHFTEARPENWPFSYNRQVIERLRSYLPILSAPKIDMTDFFEAASLSERRKALRDESQTTLPDFALQAEIQTWVTAGLPPPADLTREHAKLFEQDVCEKWRVTPLWDDRWKPLKFGPSSADFDWDELLANWFSRNPANALDPPSTP